jgi:hypothetical protein
MILKVTKKEEPTLFVELSKMVIDSIRDHRRGSSFYTQDIVEFKPEDIEYYPEIPDFVEKYVGTWITDSYIWDDNYSSDEQPTTLTRVERKEIVSYEWVKLDK